MFIYSNNIIQFINHIKISLKEILSKEIGLKVSGDRFYDKKQECSYPIKVVVFNNRKLLGYFDSQFYELGFHECLMRSKKELLQDIIRHELAHYITFINYSNTVNPHGDEFKAFCQRMGWSEEVQKATTCIDDGLDLPGSEESHILRKVQKLMSLAESSNKNESEQAMIKSQQLLLKHNIDASSIEDENDEKIILKRIMKQTKTNAKMHAIAQILETFFVNCVYSRRDDFTFLEIVGNAINVEIAEHVANVLQYQLETLWDQTRKHQVGLKGMTAKNSFFMGVAKGYCNKIQFLKREYNTDTTNALMIIEKKLVDAKEMIYPRLTKSNSNARYCSESARLGEQAGSKLNINHAINHPAKNSETCLTFLQ